MYQAYIAKHFIIRYISKCYSYHGICWNSKNCKYKLKMYSDVIFVPSKHHICFTFNFRYYIAVLAFFLLEALFSVLFISIMCSVLKFHYNKQTAARNDRWKCRRIFCNNVKLNITMKFKLQIHQLEMNYKTFRFMMCLC